MEQRDEEVKGKKVSKNVTKQPSTNFGDTQMPWKMQKPGCLKVAEITVLGIPKTKKSKVECKTAQYKNCSFKSDE